MDCSEAKPHHRIFTPLLFMPGGSIWRLATAFWMQACDAIVGNFSHSSYSTLVAELPSKQLGLLSPLPTDPNGD